MKGFLFVLAFVVVALVAVVPTQATGVNSGATVLVQPQAFQVLAVPHVQAVAVEAVPVAVQKQVVVNRVGVFARRNVVVQRNRVGVFGRRAVSVNVLGGGCANGSCNVGSSALFFSH